MTEEVTKLEIPNSAEKIAPPEEDGEDEIFTYAITYTNGVMRRIYTDEDPDEVQQRWASALGGQKAKILRFPAGNLDGFVRKDDLELAAEAKALGVTEDQFKAMANGSEAGDDALEALGIAVYMPVPVVLLRSDLILDVVLIAEDEEDDDEPEAPPAPAPAPTPEKGKKKKRVPIGFVE